MRYRLAIIAFLVSLPFWWGINVAADSLEEFFLLDQLTKNTHFFNARIDESINQLKLSRIRAENEKVEQLQAINFEADSVIVASNYKVLFEKNSRIVRPIASLSKLMTAVVIYDFKETYDPDQVITITKKSVDQDGISGLKVGDTLSVEELLYKTLVESSNDAAFALTSSIGEKAFVDLMNYEAKEIGLEETFFVNSTGLDPDNPLGARNVSTAYDLVKLAEYILENYKEIFDTTIIEDTENTDKLLGEYPEIIGGKTGWTPSAGGCLITVTEKRDGYYVSIVLGAEDRFSEMRKILDILK